MFFGLPAAVINRNVCITVTCGEIVPMRLSLPNGFILQVACWLNRLMFLLSPLASVPHGLECQLFCPCDPRFIIWFCVFYRAIRSPAKTLQNRRTEIAGIARRDPTVAVHQGNEPILDFGRTNHAPHSWRPQAPEYDQEPARSAW